VLYWKQALAVVHAAASCVRRREAMLAEKQSVTLIVRLVLDAQGRLQHGITRSS
jgi:hypothetical protein